MGLEMEKDIHTAGLQENVKDNACARMAFTSHWPFIMGARKDT